MTSDQSHLQNTSTAKRKRSATDQGSESSQRLRSTQQPQQAANTLVRSVGQHQSTRPVSRSASGSRPVPLTTALSRPSRPINRSAGHPRPAPEATTQSRITRSVSRLTAQSRPVPTTSALPRPRSSRPTTQSQPVRQDLTRPTRGSRYTTRAHRAPPSKLSRQASSLIENSSDKSSPERNVKPTEELTSGMTTP
ncbi:hypothetical protein GGI05_005170, partial [Coemansia sp. RSA 2603]